ncbi:MAG: hypothetical protein ACT4P6_22510 [Gemmatimonadaceae bacterium]
MTSGYAALFGCTFVAFAIGARSATAQARWELKVEQRFVLDDGPADPIKDLRDFAVGRDGRLYVLENTVKQVHVYLARGRYSKSFSRNGSGPGELRDANGMISGPDGSLWINDHGNSRISNYSPDGAFLRQMLSEAHGYGFRWSGFISAEGTLVDELFGARQSGAPVLHVLQRRRVDGTVLDTITISLCPGDGERKTIFRAQSKGSSSNMQIPFVAPRLSAFDARGAVWCNVGTAYRVLRLDVKSGAVTAQAVRAVNRYPIPRAMRDSAIAEIRATVAKYDASDVDFSWVPNEFPYLQNLLVDDRGRLWARRRSADRTRTEFDVFDAQGRLLTSASLPARVSAYGRMLVRGDEVYAVVLDDDDVPSIVRARIVTGAQ